MTLTKDLTLTDVAKPSIPFLKTPEKESEISVTRYMLRKATKAYLL